MKSKHFNIQINLENVFLKQTSKPNDLIKHLGYKDVCSRTLKFIAAKMKQIKDEYLIYEVLTSIDPESCSGLIATQNKEAKTITTLKLQNLYCKTWRSMLERRGLSPEMNKMSLQFLCHEGLSRVNEALCLVDKIIDAFESEREVAYFSLEGVYMLMLYSKTEYLEVFDRIINVLDYNLFLSEHCTNFLNILASLMRNMTMSDYHARIILLKLDAMLLFVDQKYHAAICQIIVNCLKRNPSLESLYNKTLESEETEQLCGVYALMAVSSKGEVASKICKQLAYKLNNKVDETSVGEMIELDCEKCAKVLENNNVVLRNVRESHMQIPMEVIEKGREDGLNAYETYFEDATEDVSMDDDDELSTSAVDEDVTMDDDNERASSNRISWLQTFRWCSQIQEYFTASVYWSELKNDIVDINKKLILAMIASKDKQQLLVLCLRMLNFAAEKLCLYTTHDFCNIQQSDLPSLIPVFNEETRELKSVSLVYHLLSKVMDIVKCTANINVQLCHIISSLMTKMMVVFSGTYPAFMLSQINAIKAHCGGNDAKSLLPVRAKKHIKFVELLDPDLLETVDPKKNVAKKQKKMIDSMKKSVSKSFKRQKDNAIKDQVQKKIREAALRRKKTKEILSSM